ncbi:hypothetical protein J7T55_009386 [Diaporthe amygdali]|uniref:uncharacterized protein n=1 Tax=Phomopsis amygdali TaxID=1214568 RepID=UPI0022FED8AB|nr:uncharacterized protein J7T55_009386 [Diaporthe amygdali]KAJ0107421.1 hypothetical protein J7T55_009386 [Diaporthe amygdali]
MQPQLLLAIAIFLRTGLSRRHHSQPQQSQNETQEPSTSILGCVEQGASCATTAYMDDSTLERYECAFDLVECIVAAV